MGGFFSLLGFWEPWGVGGIVSPDNAPIIISGLSIQQAISLGNFSMAPDVIIDGLAVGN
jgi:acyl-CoA reductase-like NAD-dependent aldehyde dehydrogenase